MDDVRRMKKELLTVDVTLYPDNLMLEFTESAIAAHEQNTGFKPKYLRISLPKSMYGLKIYAAKKSS